MKKKNCLFNLSKYNVLVTGATGYLGRCMVDVLIQYGAHVFINSRSSMKIEKYFKHYKNCNQITKAVFDISDFKKVKLFFKKNKKFHAIINNAYSGNGGHIEKFSKNDYIDSFNIGLISVAHLNYQAFLPLKKGAKEIGTSSIINIASMYGTSIPKPENYLSHPEMNNPPHYGVTKAALIHYSKYAARYFSKYNIRVNSISPGPFPDKHVQKKIKFISNLKKCVPLNRIGYPEDLKTALLFLISSNSSYVTGINLNIDGGWSINN